MNTQTQKLATRDFISVGIYSVIYSVVAFVIGGITQMTPITFPFMPLIVALFTGVVFMLFVAKIPKRGALSILGIIAGILLFITGMYWMMAVAFMVLGVAADWICASKQYRSFKRNLLGYCVLSLAPLGAYIPMVAMPAQFAEFMSGRGDSSAFSGILESLAGAWWVIPVMIAGTMACAVVGGFIGKKLMKKHFEKAGIV